MLGQDQLSRALFPVGGQPKAETRAHATRLGLPVAGKADSQEVCFVPGADHGAFLAAHAPQLAQGGRVLDHDGRVVGRHDGVFRFTVGQRRGLGISMGRPSYVLDVDATTSTVTIGPAELLARPGLVADGVSWVAGSPPTDEPFEADVSVRYRGDPVPAVVAPIGGGAVRVEFGTPQRAIAPGQSVVFYRRDEVLGGGRIRESLRRPVGERV
jgi:tRNA-specific 2-thiouridylase